jgi:hypothetical protein
LFLERSDALTRLGCVRAGTELLKVGRECRAGSGAYSIRTQLFLAVILRQLGGTD